MTSNPQAAQTVAQLGEDAVLAAIIPLLPSAAEIEIGPGDDAAGIRSNGITLLSTDTMVCNRDFSLQWSTPRDLGRKAVASNFADIAAMGAAPTGLLVALTVPADTTLHWLQQFAGGLADAISRLAPTAGVIGGDIALGDELHIAITSVGSLAAQQAVTRGGAKVGDVVAIAGEQGWSAAGLDLLRSENYRPDSADSLPEAAMRAIAAQLSPEPPILLGEVARRAGARAMIDISDGLVRDAGRIAKSSSVAVDLDSSALQHLVEPLLEVARLLETDHAAIQARAQNWVLQGGEDHCLLAMFPDAASIPAGFRRIGATRQATAGAVLLDGQPLKVGGWDALNLP